ncbi:spore germination protein KC [Paenibacillus rhizosphaerae]|uniref:Spore germination protein KC n=1 Tax=Paenibacillus rhizosphaerae TaxID=297318 RepID=A0A839TY29_9BACL|nr:Ger(x)C family spore germination protein [Paenibacillus rhizosphaerae]MBB3131361.1 spore germination protein KC [Paenibacillus rhizosphaerae]
MIRPILCIVLLAAVLLTTGCWDRTEINDLAFDMGTAFDLTEKGELQASIQIALPQQAGMTGGNNQKDKFFVLTASGKNHIELQKQLQKKLSRQLFTSHRGVIFISERLARRGLDDVLDVFTHDPHNRLRTYIMVVKDQDAKNIVQVRYPFEEGPSEAVRAAESMGGQLSVTLRDFFIAASSEGASPVTAVIQPEIPDGNIEREMFRFTGAAVFKGLKLAGFLNEKETDGLLWLTGRMGHSRITAALPEGYGNVGMVLIGAQRKITFIGGGSKVKFNVRLTGEGDLFENNTSLDVSKMQNLRIAQKALEREVEKQVRDCLFKIQKQYQSDVAGFGGVLYRSQPRKWKQIKNKWDKVFPEAEITVTVKLNLRDTGVAGPPLQLKKREIVN